MASTSKRKRVLVGATGSVAAIKVPELVERLQEIREPQAREFWYLFWGCFSNDVTAVTIYIYSWRWRLLQRRKLDISLTPPSSTSSVTLTRMNGYLHVFFVHFYAKYFHVDTYMYVVTLCCINKLTCI